MSRPLYLLPLITRSHLPNLFPSISSSPVSLTFYAILIFLKNHRHFIIKKEKSFKFTLSSSSSWSSSSTTSNSFSLVAWVLSPWWTTAQTLPNHPKIQSHWSPKHYKNYKKITGVFTKTDKIALLKTLSQPQTTTTSIPKTSPMRRSCINWRNWKRSTTNLLDSNPKSKLHTTARFTKLGERLRVEMQPKESLVVE